MELFEMIATMKNDQDAGYSVVELCLALGVSRRGYYDYEQKPEDKRRRVVSAPHVSPPFQPH